MLLICLFYKKDYIDKLHILSAYVVYKSLHV